MAPRLLLALSFVLALQSPRSAAAAPAVQGDEVLRSAVEARRIGDFARVVALLHRAPRPALPALSAAADALEADALIWLGRASEALPLLERAQASTPFEPQRLRIQARHADALIANGDSAGAIREWESLLGHPGAGIDLAAWRSAAFQAALTAGDATAIARFGRDLWLLHPDHPLAADPRAAPKDPSVADRLARANRLSFAVQPARCAEEASLGLRARPRPDQRSSLELLLGKCLADVKQRTAAREAWNRAIAAKPTGTAADEARLLLARGMWRRGNPEGALAMFEEVAKRPGRFGDEAALLQGFIAFEQGDWVTASSRLDARVASRKGWPKADEAIWFSALAQHRAGDDGEALTRLGRLLEGFPGSPLRPQALYWQAKLGPKERRTERLLAVMGMAPTHFYGHLSRLALSQAGVATAAGWGALPATLPAVRKPVRFEAEARAFHAVGLVAERAEILDEAAARASGALELEAVAQLATELGEWGRAYAIANRSLWGLASEKADPIARSLLFPEAHSTLVREACEPVGLDPAFAWAVMRRESAFEPRAQSAARAFGLMQVLAPTARRIGGSAGAPGIDDADDLLEPETIVPLATWYLASLQGRFGAGVATAGAYNAGPRAMAGWLARNGDLPLDEFVEAIPYRETRLYVKGVVGDWLTYRELRPSRAAGPSFQMSLPAAGVGVGF